MGFPRCRGGTGGGNPGITGVGSYRRQVKRGWEVGLPMCRGRNPEVKGAGSLQEVGEEGAGRGIPKV